MPIGLVVFSSENDNGEWYHDIEELFLINTARHKNTAQKIAVDFWNEKSGIGTLHILKDNKNAVRFWEKLLKINGYEYTKKDEGNMLAYHFPLKKS